MSRIFIATALVLPGVLASFCCHLHACEGSAPAESETKQETDVFGLQNFSKLAIPTLGGKQFWADEYIRYDWRIQRNVLTGHHRLLDGKDQRHAWGTLTACQTALTEKAAELDIPVLAGRVVILL
ncbi:MAG: hypothetical protein N2C12_09360, partial [Planctomycetales bacterium]